MQHMDVSIRELKDKLSEYLRLVAQGEEIVVTNHGKPLARITAYGAQSESEEDAIARINASPWVRAGSGAQLTGSRHPARLPTAGQTLIAMLSKT